MFVQSALKQTYMYDRIQKCHLMVITIFTHQLWLLIHIKAKSIVLCFPLEYISVLVLEVKVKPFCGINVRLNFVYN